MSTLCIGQMLTYRYWANVILEIGPTHKSQRWPNAYIPTLAQRICHTHSRLNQGRNWRGLGVRQITPTADAGQKG